MVLFAGSGARETTSSRSMPPTHNEEESVLKNGLNNEKSDSCNQASVVVSFCIAETIERAPADRRIQIMERGNYREELLNYVVGGGLFAITFMFCGLGSLC